MIERRKKNRMRHCINEFNALFLDRTKEEQKKNGKHNLKSLHRHAELHFLLNHRINLPIRLQKTKSVKSKDTQKNVKEKGKIKRKKKLSSHLKGGK